MMNRIANVDNKYQQFDKFPRALCVCSAGLLRSPTAAFVLSQEPFNFNTRSAGLSKEYAIIGVDDVLLAWADLIVCMEPWQAAQINSMLPNDHEKEIWCLGIDDAFGYRNQELIDKIKEKCIRLISNKATT